MKMMFAALLVMACLLTGCNGNQGNSMQDSSGSTNDASISQTDQMQSDEESTFPGTYTVPGGLVKSEVYSTADKIFYLQEGHEKDEQPDNIAINVGSNRYSLDEHPVFRDAILQQLLMQLDGVKADLNGDGTYTEQGYVLYTFTIKESETGIVTKQYYIVDDHRYCLIQLTNYTGSERMDETAETIVNSFVWSDLQ